jgi:uncharacterized protein (DUF2132 family)
MLNNGKINHTADPLNSKFGTNMNNAQNNDPLHGVTLENMVTRLVEHYGWEELSRRIRINCFNNDPSVKSSLKFLRRTQWARDKVERLYISTTRSSQKEE